ncbi:hypothetical protein DK37_03365, partial [Halomonas sp. SUBG004]
LGVLRFVGQRPSQAWWLLVVIWCALLLLPAPLTSSKLYLALNSLLVGLLALRASWALKLESGSATLGTRQLHYVLFDSRSFFFYIAKGLLPLAPQHAGRPHGLSWSHHSRSLVGGCHGHLADCAL